MKKFLLIATFMLLAKNISAENHDNNDDVQSDNPRWVWRGLGNRAMLSPCLSELTFVGGMLRPAGLIYTHDVMTSFTHRNPNIAVDAGLFYSIGRFRYFHSFKTGMVIEFFPITTQRARFGAVSRIGYMNISRHQNTESLNYHSEFGRGFGASFGAALEIPLGTFSTPRVAHLPTLRAEIGVSGNTVNSSVNTRIAIGVNWRLAAR